MVRVAQLLGAPLQIGFEAVIESDEVLVVDRAPDFDIVALLVGVGPRRIAVFVVVEYFLLVVREVFDLGNTIVVVVQRSQPIFLLV